MPTGPKINVTVLLDRSGSMQGPTLKDHIGGMRSFVEDQQGQEGTTKFNFIQFDSENAFEVKFDGININNVNTNDIRLHPRGGTPLLDAVGKTFNHIEEQELKDESDQVALMIITDGGENCSKEWKLDQVKHLIEQKKDDWSIMFLGADLDSFGDAYNMGVQTSNMVGTQGSDGTQYMYSGCMSDKLSAARGLISMGASKAEVMNAFCYTDDDRQYGDNSQVNMESKS